jgi:DNA-binding XRE family transcriptional regulator
MRLKKSQKHDTITCKVKEFRLKKGWSQEELAAKLDIRRQAVYDIESGRYLPNTAIALLNPDKKSACLFTPPTQRKNRMLLLPEKNWSAFPATCWDSRSWRKGLWLPGGIP